MKKVIHATELKEGQEAVVVKWPGRERWPGKKIVRKGRDLHLPELANSVYDGDKIWFGIENYPPSRYPDFLVEIEGDVKIVVASVAEADAIYSSLDEDGKSWRDRPKFL